jgi:hypothetical protein
MASGKPETNRRNGRLFGCFGGGGGGRLRRVLPFGTEPFVTFTLGRLVGNDLLRMCNAFP